MDVVMWEEFKPCPNIFPHANGKILNDEEVIIHSSGPMGEPEVFEPNAWVCLPSVFGDVGGRPETLRERCFSDAPAEGPRPWALGAGVPVVWQATAPGACFAGSLDVLAGIHGTRCRMVDSVITLGPKPVANGAMGVLVRIGVLVCRW